MCIEMPFGSMSMAAAPNCITLWEEGDAGYHSLSGAITWVSCRTWWSPASAYVHTMSSATKMPVTGSAHQMKRTDAPARMRQQ